MHLTMELSRRQITRVAGLATAGTLFSYGHVRALYSNTLKVGLIGCGGRGTGAAEEALNADPNVVLSAMADAFPDSILYCLSKQIFLILLILSK